MTELNHIIKLNDKEIELTHEEARELYSMLGDMFDKPQSVPVPYWIPREYQPPYKTTCRKAGDNTNQSKPPLFD